MLQTGPAREVINAIKVTSMAVAVRMILGRGMVPVSILAHPVTQELTS
jgi:hypothetical protein